MKWGAIKHDCTKLAGIYKVVFNCKESDMLLEDVMQRFFELIKVKHPKHFRTVAI
jgi:hypothetical protein